MSTPVNCANCHPHSLCLRACIKCEYTYSCYIVICPPFQPLTLWHSLSSTMAHTTPTCIIDNSYVHLQLCNTGRTNISICLDAWITRVISFSQPRPIHITSLWDPVDSNSVSPLTVSNYVTTSPSLNNGMGLHSIPRACVLSCITIHHPLPSTMAHVHSINLCPPKHPCETPLLGTKPSPTVLDLDEVPTFPCYFKKLSSGGKLPSSQLPKQDLQPLVILHIHL